MLVAVPAAKLAACFSAANELQNVRPAVPGLRAAFDFSASLWDEGERFLLGGIDPDNADVIRDEERCGGAGILGAVACAVVLPFAMGEPPDLPFWAECGCR